MNDLRKAAEMADKQPEALRLADVLTQEGDSWWDEQAAAELRRLHEQNERLIKIIDSRPAINAGLPQPEQEWDSRHPKAQALIRERARLQIALGLVEELVDDPHFETTPMDMEYWGPLHDKLKEALTSRGKK